MHILVTGGAGYIGSHTLVELLGLGHDVTVLDSFENSSPVALGRVAEIAGRQVAHHCADIRNAGALDSIFAEARPDAVIHFAGLKAVGESGQIPLEYYDVNIGGTIRLLQAMDKAGCKRIVFSSSATVYGEPQYLPFDEAHPCAPTNVYGRTKLMAEQIISDWQSATEGTSAVLLRYFNPVGAHASARIGEDPRDIPNNLMPFVAQVAVGRRDKLAVFGDDYDTADGTGVRDYIHVVDLARAHCAAIEEAMRTPKCEAFNIGTGQGYSVMELVEAFGKACGRPIPYQVAPRRQGDIAASLADPSRANGQLGWQAELGLEAMCQSVWAWQSQNPNGYGNAE